MHNTGTGLVRDVSNALKREYVQKYSDEREMSDEVIDGDGCNISSDLAIRISLVY